jgi:non-specific serine/threonine protein kinase
VNTLGDGDLERGRALLEASLARFRELGFWTGEVLVLGNLGWVEQRAGNTERAIELMEDGAEGARSLGFSWAEQYQREGLAETTLAAGQLDDAEQHASRALELARQTGDRPSTVSCLALLARVAAARGDGEGAGLLWGVVEGEEGRGPLGIWSEQRDRNAETVPVLAGDDGFDQARVHGRVLSLADAVAYALGEPSDA